MQDTAGEIRTKSQATYSCGPLHMDEQRQDDQLEPKYNSSVPIQDVALKTYQERWTIEMGGGRGSKRSVLAVRHDDDDIGFCLVGLYGISTIVGYLRPNPLLGGCGKTWFRRCFTYIYIVIHRLICFVLSELISVARQYLPVAGNRNPVGSNVKPKLLTIQRGDISCEVNFKTVMNHNYYCLHTSIQRLLNIYIYNIAAASIYIYIYIYGTAGFMLYAFIK